MLPQPVQYGLHTRLWFSFSIDAISLISSSVRSTIVAFSSIRLGVTDLGMTASKGVVSTHTSIYYAWDERTREARSVGLERNEDIRRLDVVLLRELLHDGVAAKRSIVGA